MVAPRGVGPILSGNGERFLCRGFGKAGVKRAMDMWMKRWGNEKGSHYKSLIYMNDIGV